MGVVMPMRYHFPIAYGGSRDDCVKLAVECDRMTVGYSLTARSGGDAQIEIGADSTDGADIPVKEALSSIATVHDKAVEYGLT